MNFYLKSSQHSRWHTYLVQSYRWAGKSHTRKVINCKCKFTQPLAQSRRTNTRVTSFILFSGCGSCDIRNTQDALYQTWATSSAAEIVPSKYLCNSSSVGSYVRHTADRVVVCSTSRRGSHNCAEIHRAYSMWRLALCALISRTRFRSCHAVVHITTLEHFVSVLIS